MNATVRVHEAGSLKVTLRDPTHVVKRAQAGYRYGSNGSFQMRPITPGETVNIELPEPPSGVTRLDYYVQAFDEKDNAVMENGRPAAPKSANVDVVSASRAEPTDGKKKGFLFSTGFWAAAAGVVVVGAGTAIVLATRSKDPAQTSVFTPGLSCGAAPCN